MELFYQLNYCDMDKCFLLRPNLMSKQSEIVTYPERTSGDDDGSWTAPGCTWICALKRFVISVDLNNTFIFLHRMFQLVGWYKKMNQMRMFMWMLWTMKRFALRVSSYSSLQSQKELDTARAYWKGIYQKEAEPIQRGRFIAHWDLLSLCSRAYDFIFWRCCGAAPVGPRHLSVMTRGRGLD